MPLDVDLSLYAVTKARLLARPDLVAGVASFRWLDDPQSIAQAAVQTEPAAMPQLWIVLPGASTLRPPATFGDMLPPSQFDRGMPGRTELLIKLLFDDPLPSEQTPLEAEVIAALHSAGAKYGIQWVAGYAIRKSRALQQNRETAGVPRWLTTFNVTFDVRPKLSALVS